MSISGLVCVSAIVMVISVVIGNHWRGQSIWTIDSAHLNHLDDGNVIQIFHRVCPTKFTISPNLRYSLL